MQNDSVMARLVAAEATIDGLERRSRRRFQGTVVVSVALIAAVSYLGGGSMRAVGATDERTLQAPFKVVDGNGRTLLLVQNKGDQNQMELFGIDGAPAVIAVAFGDRGAVIVGDGQGPNLGIKGALAIEEDGSAGLELRDAQSKQYADIKKGPNSQGLIVYRPDTGKPSIEVFANESTGKIAFRDINGHVSGVFEDGSGTSLVLADDAGKSFASIIPGDKTAASPGGDPKPDGNKGIALFDEKGHRVAFVGLNEKNSGYLSVWDDAKSTANLGISSEGSGGLVRLTGADGKVGAWLAASGPAGLFLAGPSGTAVAELSVASNGGRFWLGNSSGVGMLEGGITDSNRGLLKAGPFTGGPASLTGLPTAILGHK